MSERFIWEGPERSVDAVIRRKAPLPPGWWFRSYIHHDIVGWVQLFEVKPDGSKSALSRATSSVHKAG
jgi:hypothetical protein